MRLSFFLILCIIFNTFYAQEILNENEAYYTNVNRTEFGYVFTDNYASALYKFEGHKIHELVSSPGCGRYYSVSPDGTMIGFKYIHESGKQQPAFIDLKTGKKKTLFPPTDLCGQPVFSDDNRIAFTVGEQVFIVKNEKKLSAHGMPEYINKISFSADGKRIAFCDKNGSLNILNVSDGKISQFISEDSRYVFPQWSPDGKKLLLQSNGGIVVFRLDDPGFSFIDKGISPVWHENSRTVIYVKQKISRFRVIDSELYIADIKNKQFGPLTNSGLIHEIQPSVYQGKIQYGYVNTKRFSEAAFDASLNRMKDKKDFFTYEEPPKIKRYQLQKKSETLVPGIVPYIHQVYDTPENHWGYWSCAPTTCAMGLAYYNILPPWPAEIDHGVGPHISYYGNYVAEKYRYNELYYDIGALPGGGETAYGGYGYMWGLGSPNSKQKEYIENHGVQSDQLWTSSCTFEDTKDQIDQGYVHPICSYLTSGGHLTLAIGYIDGQHTLIFNDPYGDKNTPGYPSYDGDGAYYDWPGYNNGYQNLDADGSHGYVAWTTKMQYEEISYNDTLIDDVFYNHGFYMNNFENGSHQRYFRDAIAGYNDHLWYTITIDHTEDICWVWWKPILDETNLYDVKAYIPSVHANAEEAKYIVFHEYGTSEIRIDQSENNGEWVTLGRFYLSSTDEYCKVYLGDNTGINGQEIAFDAVLWDTPENEEVSAGFHVSGNTVNAGNQVQFYNTSLNADAYEWSFEGGIPETSSEEQPAVTYNQAGEYDVRLIASNSQSADTLLLTDYIRIKGTVGLSDKTVEMIKIFPNPCGKSVNILLDNKFTGRYDMSIIDIYGKTVYHETGIKLSRRLPNRINTSNLNGMYLLRLEFRGMKYTEKLIVRNKGNK